MRAVGAALAGLLAVLPAAGEGQVQQSQRFSQSAGTAAGLTLPVFALRRERRLLVRDTDGDGKVSRAEFLTGVERAKGDPATRFTALDRNRDGVIDKAEIDAMAARRFARLDVNRDGVLTPGERTPGRNGTAGTDEAG